MSVTGSPFLRLTVLGQGRKAHLVLPTDQPSALLMPQILELLGDASGGSANGTVRRHELATLTGELIDPNVPLTDTGLTDGAVLRLSPSGDGAGTPWVLDMTEATEATDVRGRWSATAQRWTVTAVAALLVLVGLTGAMSHLDRPGIGWLTASATLLLLAMLPTLVDRELGRPAAWGLWAVGSVALLAFLVTSDLEPLVTAACAWLLAVLATVAAGVVLDRLRVATPVAVVLTVVTATAVVGSQTIDDVAIAAGVTATVALLLFGVLPRVALMASGTFRLDQQVAAGQEVGQRDAGAAVAAAHWAIGGCVAVLAVAFGASGWLIGRHGAGEVWTAVLLGALTAGIGLRARHFPLAVERFLMWAAAVPGAAGAASYLATEVDEAPYLPGLMMVVVGGVVALLALLRTSDYTGAQLRRTATRIETIALLTTIPMIVGGLGVYDQLLDTF